MNTSMIDYDGRIKSLAMLVARNRVGPDAPVEHVLKQAGVAPAEFSQLLDDPVFKRYVTTYVAELEETGFSFKAKCRVLTEDAAASIYHIVKDVEAPAASRIRGFEVLAEMAELAPKTNPAANAGANVQPFHITFNIPSANTNTPAAIVQTETPALEGAFTVAFDMAEAVDNPPAQSDMQDEPVADKYAALKELFPSAGFETYEDADAYESAA